MNIYIVDDDINIINLLKIIIRERNLGTICGFAQNGEDALDDINHIKPDIVIVDLLMPKIDGITLVKKAKKFVPNSAFIMLSQVSSKDMIASAYESGIEFFLQKPINSIEVEAIIKKVCKTIQLESAFKKMNSILHNEISIDSSSDNSATVYNEDKTYLTIIQDILTKLGIIGEIGAKDIINVVSYIIDNSIDINDFSLADICSNLSTSPKSYEQRIRRTAYSGLVNIANLGIEDYANETFVEFSNTLFNFEQVKKEMDFIREKSNVHGKVHIKKFINSLIFYCNKN